MLNPIFQAGVSDAVFNLVIVHRVKNFVSIALVQFFSEATLKHIFYSFINTLSTEGLFKIIKTSTEKIIFCT